jgi:3'-phosphoadenosine 5'-phosphosulfate (PAPS) 3'-phosphatase
MMAQNQREQKDKAEEDCQRQMQSAFEGEKNVRKNGSKGIWQQQQQQQQKIQQMMSMMIISIFGHNQTATSTFLPPVAPITPPSFPSMPLYT